MKRYPITLLFGAVLSAFAEKPLEVTSVVAASSVPKDSFNKAIDGLISDNSRWVSAKGMPTWIELKLPSKARIGGIHVYSGINDSSAIEDFVVQFSRAGKWENIPSAQISGNKKTSLAIPFDDTIEVNTDRIRLFITASPGGVARVKEIVLFRLGSGDLFSLQDSALSRYVNESSIPLIYLNQSGFNLGKPKRFTAPTLAEGTKFSVRLAKGGSSLFDGEIKGNIGDFSTFNPISTDEFIIAAGGIISVPFRIGNNWLERVSYQRMIDFMIDSRHYVGTWKKACKGSFGWRDDTYYGWELTTLVPQYFSNPSAYDRMPHQVKYQKPTDLTLWGKLEPYSEDAPDIVKLIHWGADVLVTQGCKHQLHKAQLAYFLYAWPQLKTWLPEQNYRVVYNYVFDCWVGNNGGSAEGNLLSLKTKIGSTKGELPPGFSVEPNLLMYEVAKRERRPDANLYLEAAIKQTEWMIETLDWGDPQTTKGQRMSEFVTITGLAHFLRQYPDQAPTGLREKINEWIKVALRRSVNLWDFRKFDDGEKWTPMGEKPTMWNETGNVVGFPSALLASMPFVKDSDVKKRMEVLVYSHFDNCFGRNPTGRHFSARANKEIEGVEFDWYNRHPGGIGMLENVRFVLDGSPKNPAYPYHPEKGPIGWTEGWVQHNVAYNISMAYLAHTNTSLQTEIDGENLFIRLIAPLNFDYTKAETGVVQIVSDSGDFEIVTVTETSLNSNEFTGKVRLRRGGAAVKNNGYVQMSEAGWLSASYGYGYMSRTVLLKGPATQGKSP